MRVERELPDHPKFRKLKRAVGPLAMEYLIRLWGHCEGSQRGERWPSADPEYVEDVCLWEGERGALYAALKEGWIDEVADALVIHDWNKMTSYIVTAWKNGANGGRRKDKTPPVTVGKPDGSPTVTGGEPAGNQPLKQRREEKSRVEQEAPNREKKKAGAANGTGAAVAASRTQWASLKARITELEALGRERNPQQTAELRSARQKKAAVEELQREGTFA